MLAGSVHSVLKRGSPSIRVVRLRWPKSAEGGEEQSNNGCPSPAHLAVAKERNINVIDNEIQWHTQCEQKGKTAHLVSRHGSAEDEGYPHYDCPASDNSKKEGEHSFLAKQWILRPLFELVHVGYVEDRIVFIT